MLPISFHTGFVKLSWGDLRGSQNSSTMTPVNLTAADLDMFSAFVQLSDIDRKSHKI